MLFRLTAFNSATCGVMLLTLGMIWARYRFDPERTWLLFYYAPVAAYTMRYWDSLHPPWVLAGVICALVLRFEFMGDWVAKGVRVVESAFFVYVLWRCGVLLELWAPLPI
jgi:hypothetical protein